MQRKSSEWHRRELQFEIENGEGAALRVALKGGITEDAFSPFERIAEQLEKHAGQDVAFDLSQISFLNSIGIQNWVRFMNRICAGRKVQFEKCSYPMVEHITLMMGISGTVAVTGFQLPYFCAKCKKESLEFFLTKDLVDGATPPVAHCGCGTAMDLEMMEDDFERFVECIRPQK